MKLAFYKEKGNWIDLLVRKWTNSPYSHCEIIIDNKWYSSSPRDGGVRNKNIEPSKDAWDYIDLDVSNKQEEVIKLFFQEQDQKKYDFKGIFLSQILPFSIDNKNKWFCSEICSRSLQLIRFLSLEKNARWYNPGRLYKELSKINKKHKYLKTER